jgi:hypothetical protein
VVSLPVTILNSPSVTQASVPAFGTGADIAGVVIWVIGWLLETQADLSKVRYHIYTYSPVSDLNNVPVPMEDDKASEMASHADRKLEMVPPSTLLWGVSILTAICPCY